MGDTKKLESRGISGSEWYNLEAFRAVLLLDKRFGYEANAKKVPSWLEKSVVEPNFRKGMARVAQFYHHNKNKTSSKPQAIAMPSTAKVEKKAEISSKPKAQFQPPNKRKKIVLKPRQELFTEASEKNDPGTDVRPDMKENVGNANNGPSIGIQEFVLLLKTKLEKSNLKKLIGEIKAYKELGTIDPLLKLLQECCLKGIISIEDINKFRPFVRRDDEEEFNKIL